MDDAIPYVGSGRRGIAPRDAMKVKRAVGPVVVQLGTRCILRPPWMTDGRCFAPIALYKT